MTEGKETPGKHAVWKSGTGKSWTFTPPSGSWQEMEGSGGETTKLLELEYELSRLTAEKGHKHRDVKALHKQVQAMKTQQGKGNLLPTEGRAAGMEAAELSTPKILQERSSSTGQPKPGGQTETSISGRK